MTGQWSPQQAAVFGWFAEPTGHLVVRARAGTGKTTTILEAIRHVTDPEARVLLCAFNARIAKELAGKLTDPRAEARTLHSLGFAYLRRHWPRVTVDDTVEAERIQAAGGGSVPDVIVTVIRRLVGLAKGALPFGNPAQLEELAEAYGCEPEGSGWEADGWGPARIAQVAHQAMRRAHERDPEGRITFDDMLYLPVALRLIRPWYSWVIVDEAQDMNATQLLLAQGACQTPGHIVVVGDDRQAIYGFRGADSGALDRLKADLGADELPLSTTYRCPRLVVEHAARIVVDYQAAPDAPDGIVDALGLERLAETVQPGEAILSRVNAPLVSLCLGLIRKGIPARVEGRDLGKSLAAIVRKQKARSVPDFLRRVQAWRDRERTRIKAKGGRHAENRIQVVEDQAETLSALAEGCVSVDEILRRCEAMFSDSVDAQGQRAPALQVVCSSIHKAKGLEWDRVFVLERTLYCNGTRRADLEESNLEYVAVTRSKRHLTMLQG